MYRIMMLNLGIYFFHMCLKEVFAIGAINTIGTNTMGTNEQTGGQILHKVAQSGVSSYSCGGYILHKCVTFKEVPSVHRHNVFIYLRQLSDGNKMLHQNQYYSWKSSILR